MTETTLERIQADTKAAMKAGDRERVSHLRLLVDALQKDAKEGGSDEVAVLRRERKRRLEAAEAYRGGGDQERAAAEDREAELIAGYLPAELSDDTLITIVEAAIAETGADSIKQMGQVIGVVMGKAQGQADGKRVSTLVRERLGEG